MTHDNSITITGNKIMTFVCKYENVDILASYKVQWKKQVNKN